MCCGSYEDRTSSKEWWESLDLGTIEDVFEVFPDQLEAYCVLAFMVASAESQEWSGATYDHLDRIAVGALRRKHSKISWKRLGKWVWSFGRSKELTRADVLVLLTQSFNQLFWVSMKEMVEKGYVRVEKREIDDMNVDVFFPSDRLVNKILNR